MPYHQTWLSVIRRCYSQTYLKKYPAYKGCSVDQRWKKLSSFIAWMKIQPEHDLWVSHNYQVDKDFLFPNERVYGPDTCVLLPSPSINGLFGGMKKGRVFPLGVSYKGGPIKNIRPRSIPVGKRYISACSALQRRGIRNGKPGRLKTFAMQ